MTPTSLPNFNKPPIHVMHSDLRRTSEETAYRSFCPTCGKGVLFVFRDQTTFRLNRLDRCTYCGQSYIYDDAVIGGEIPEPLPSFTSE
jgi:uncharacterized protein (DUF983 family)